LINSSGGSVTTLSSGGISSASNLTMELINRLINVQLSEVTRKIEETEGQLTANKTEVDDYKIQTIDRTIKCETTLDVIKSLPKFTGKITQYVGWREAAETAISLYKIESEQYFIA